MPNENKVIFNDSYIITTINTENKIIKRPYTNKHIASNKKHNNSKSFKNTLDSLALEKSNEHFESFSQSLSSEMDSTLKFQNQQCHRIIQTHSNNAILNNSNSNTTELSLKLRDAMNINVDVSSIYEKMEKLNSLKKKSKI